MEENKIIRDGRGMNLSYKRELDHNYMIIEEDCREEKEGFEIYMMEENITSIY